MQLKSTAEVTSPGVSQRKPLRVVDVAERLDVDKTTIYRAIKKGDLVAYRVGTGRGTLRISPQAYAEYEVFTMTAARAEVA